jgi:hypothetical protein
MSCCLLVVCLTLFLVIFLIVFSYVYYSVYESNGAAFLCIIVFASLFLSRKFLSAYFFTFYSLLDIHSSFHLRFVCYHSNPFPSVSFPFLPFSISKDKTQDTLLKASLHPRLYEACVYVTRLSDVLTLLRMI